MTIYKKPDLKVFGSNAKPTEIAEFEDLLRGWGVTIEKTNGIPPMEWFNYLFNRLDGNINYILQNGVTEYDTSLEYPQNAVVKSNGKLYLCLRQNTNKPLSNGAYWELLIKNATTSQKGVVQLSSSVTSTDETKASTPKATKVAYDKAVQADNNANSRVSKNGDTIRFLNVQAINGYSNVTLKNGKNRDLSIYAEPVASKTMGSLRSPTNTIQIPEKSGALALQNDVDKAQERADSAYDLADSKFSKSGGKINGSISVESESQFGIVASFKSALNPNLSSAIRMDNKDGLIFWQDFTVSGGSREYYRAQVPLKNGMILLDTDMSNSIESASTSTVATSKAVQSVNDKVNINNKAIDKAQKRADSAYNLADSKFSKSGGEISGQTDINVTSNDIPLRLSTSQQFNLALSLKNNKAEDEYSACLRLEDKDFTDSSRLSFFINNNGKYSSVRVPEKNGVLALREDGVPAGAIMPYAGDDVPTGWLRMDNGYYDPTTYPDLFAVLGYYYGRQGNKFLVPSIENRFIRGMANGLKRGQKQEDAIRNIMGSFGNVMAYSMSTGGAFSSERFHGNADNPGAKGWEVTFDASRVVPTADENRPKSIAFPYIIKY